MILRVRHAMIYAYGGRQPVALAAHLLRLRPRALAWQRVLRFALAVDPAPPRQRDGADHFGNPIAWMFHDEPHARLEIASEASVEMLPRPVPPATPPWEQVANAAHNQAWAWREAEFAFPSPLAPPLPEARLFAALSFLPGRPLAEAAACLARRMGQEFRYQPGAAGLSTPLARVLAQRVGGCQDLAHAMIAGLRGLGLPARCVSGYALTVPPPGSERPREIGQLHAWVSCWLGPGLGWFDLDPVSGRTVDQGYVCLAWGRDYGDVSPMRSVLLGGEGDDITVRVGLEPSEAQDSG